MAATAVGGAAGEKEARAAPPGARGMGTTADVAAAARACTSAARTTVGLRVAEAGGRRVAGAGADAAAGAGAASSEPDPLPLAEPEANE